MFLLAMSVLRYVTLTVVCPKGSIVGPLLFSTPYYSRFMLMTLLTVVLYLSLYCLQMILIVFISGHNILDVIHVLSQCRTYVVVHLVQRQLFLNVKNQTS